MTVISRAPVARPDYEAAALGAGAGGLLAGGGAGWGFAKLAGLPGFIPVLNAFAQIGWGPLPLACKASVGAALLAAGGVAGAVYYMLASEKVSNEVHSSGPQLRNGTAPAKKAVKRDPSPILFYVAGLPITLDRIRRSLLILGSIGGGKTQVIWHFLKGLFDSGFRLLIVDGPKGDYTTCWPWSKPLLVAPWHRGPAWDVAKDVPTRAHAITFAFSIIPVSEADPLWGNAAAMILVAVICKLQAERGIDWGWNDLFELVNLPVEQLKEIAQAHYPPAVRAVEDAESKTTQSITINIAAYMGPIYELALAWKNCEKRFSFIDWWEGKYSAQVVILQSSAEFQKISQAYISGVLSLLSAKTASATFPESKTRKNVIVIDEFAQLPRIAGIEKFIEIGRSKGCSLFGLGTQSLCQIRKIYGQDDMQSWSSMIGTKIFARVNGADDAAMVIDEIGHTEIFRRTETVSSNQGQQTVSVGWQSDKKPAVSQSDLEALGPDAAAGGCWVVVKGMGPDPLRTLFPFVSYPPIRPVFVENTAFNAHISKSEHTQTPFIEAAGETVEPDAEHAHTDTEAEEALGSDVCVEEIEHTQTPVSHLIFETGATEAEHVQPDGNALEEAAQSHVLETVVSDVVAEALGVDSHSIEAVLHALEMADENTSTPPAVEPISTVAVPVSNTPKRIKVRKRSLSNQAQPPATEGESCL